MRARAEKARAEEALRRSEANLRAIFNNSLQAFVLVDRDGTIQALNPTAARMERPAPGPRGCRRATASPTSSPTPPTSFHAALGGRGPQPWSAASAIPTASDRWFETTHAPVVDEEGTVIGVCLNARDVSERKQAERALRESEARYRDLFDNASDLVCATDLDGAFLYVNRAWHDAIGLSRRRAAGAAGSSTWSTPTAGSATPRSSSGRSTGETLTTWSSSW